MALKSEEMEILCVSSTQIVENLDRLQGKFKDVCNRVNSKDYKEVNTVFYGALKELYHLASCYEEKFIGETKQNSRKDQSKQKEDLITLYNKKIEVLKKELQKERKEKDEALTRLSALASQLLKHGNPDIADIGDKNRPTKLAENFKTLYDDEWTDAFEHVIEECKWTEDKATSLLYNLLQVCNDLSKEGLEWQHRQLEGIVKSPEMFITKQPTKHSTIIQANDQAQTKQPANFAKTVGAKASQSFRQDVPKKDDDKSSLLHIEPHFMEFRKAIAEDTLKTVTSRGLAAMVRQKIQSQDEVCEAEPVMKYISKCFRLCWYLGVQYPSMEIDFSHKSGDSLKPEQFKIYKTCGSKISHVVWPPLFLHHHGPLAGIGIAEGDGSTYI